MTKCLVIIPAYNEAENIEKVLRELKKECPEVDSIVINDCSKDSTEEVLKQMDANYISLSNNLGIGGAMQTGYKYAYLNDYDIAIQMDGDGQHDPTYISKLIQPIIDNEADLVIGSRYIEKEGFQSSIIRRMGIRILGTVMQLRCGKRVKDITSGLRAVNQKYIKQWAEKYPIDYPEPESTTAAVLNGCRVMEIPVKMRSREYGVSSINLSKSVYYMLKVTIAILLCRREKQVE